MIPTPDSHSQAAATLRESPAICKSLALRESMARLLTGPRPIGAGRVGDAIMGITEVGQEIAGASEDAVLSLASMRPSRALAPGVAAASPVAARAGA